VAREQLDYERPLAELVLRARSEKGLTQEQLAEGMSRLTDEHETYRGFGRGLIHNIEQKGRIPHPPTLGLLAKVLGLPFEVVLDGARRQRASYEQAKELTRRTEGSLWLERAECATLTDMDRRTVLRLLGAAIGSVTLDSNAARLTSALEHTRATDAVGVQVIQDGIAYARRIDDSFGSTAAARLAVAQRQLLARLLRTTHPDELERSLQSAAAEVSQLLGWLAFDMQNPELARRYLEEGLRLARQAEDNPLRAYILAYDSIVSIYTDRPDEGLTFAEAARQTADGTVTPLTMSWIATVEAEAYATVGDALKTSRALERAERELDRGRRENDPPWLYHYDRTGFTSAAGSCHLLLGQTEPARAFMRETLALSPATEVREQGLYKAWLAATYAKDGEVEEACTQAQGAIEIALLTDSDRTIQRVKGVRQQLQPWRSTKPVQELTAQLAAL
jgi:transcriptional regulator with XRE-family HTH domain